MKIHWLQHVAFEGLGSMEAWVREKGHVLSCTRLFAGETLPGLEAFDLLIVMGGPMGVHDLGEYPWLQEEKAFLRQVIAAAKPVLGVCLGAQLLADVLGAQVSANKEKEIGWFLVERASVASGRPIPEQLANVLPLRQTVFHWHGDTFTLPEKAVRLYSSAACVNQAFVYEERVVGLQFHLETTPASAATLVENCRSELVPAAWIQKEEDILAASGDVFADINSWMVALLDYLARQV
jgi:GMP synthase-like glutamine amidotransferase